MKLSVIGLLAFIGTGCVPQNQYDDLQTLYRKQEEQVADLQSQLAESQARSKALQDAATSGGTKVVEVEKTVKVTDPATAAERDKLAAQVGLLEQKLRDAGKIGPVLLEPEVDSALRDLAKSDPDLLTYDSKLGMVRFKSDLTFPLGSTDLSKNAADALKKFAEILKKPVAQKYEARVIGHTDNVRIGKPETKLRFGTNWHLSAGRAISVKDVLVDAGINPTRIQIGGNGEFRPIVANAAKGGAEQNRRVEIYLVPNSYTGPGLPAAQATPSEKPVIVDPGAAKAAPAVTPAPMK
jgi:chemotaxis protein MotB